MGQQNSHPQPGDLIEINRPLHQHWALSLGNGYVINLTPAGKQDANLGVHKVPVYTRKVKKQLLKNVVGNNTWHINNKSDYTPLPVDEIIRRAEGYIGKKVTYRVFGSNCEHFVKKLRYGDQMRGFVHGEVHIPDMTDDKWHPNPGDLIEIKRPLYQHWALYVGDGNVIHVAPVDEGASSVSASTTSTFTGKAKLKKELLEKVVGNTKWRVNNKYDCHRTPLPVQEIIRCAEAYTGKEVPCSFLLSDSEHFVTKLRYGGQMRVFVHGEVHIPDMTDDKYYPQPGDLIEIKRRGYQHWALYVGCGFVIHLTAVASSETLLPRKAKVKIELLKEVVGNDDWDVNNDYDCYSTPVPVEEIMWRAGSYNEKEVPYCFFLCNSEHFVKKLRYGDQMRAFVDVEMQSYNRTDDKWHPMPGDLIEIKRPLYQHWALYMGHGNVIHLTAVDENALPLPSSSGTLLARRAKVKKELLKEVVGNDDWNVNNKYDCYRTPFPMEEIIHRAERWLGEVVPYRLFLKNCEHFVTKLRYGDPFSSQAEVALGRFHGISTAVAGVTMLLSPPTLAAAAGVSALASVGFASSNIVHSVTAAKFFKARKDILEQKCC